MSSAVPNVPSRSGDPTTRVTSRRAPTDAHTHGVVHRDIKPSNILVTPSDFVYLVDFGIARALNDDHTALTRTGSAIGTLLVWRLNGSTAAHQTTGPTSTP